MIHATQAIWVRLLVTKIGSCSIALNPPDLGFVRVLLFIF
jgi:hypothetical protein